MTDLADIFSATGRLAREVEGFRPRPFQLEMAEEVARAIARQGVLVAEAGTGTGKTFAYLVPALASGGKVIVSTGTKTLQDQLFDRDIPTVRHALALPVTVALLKGRANYLCHYHLRRAEHEARFASREDAYHLARIKSWAQGTASGDRSELADVPENAGIWSWVTSTRDNCLGSECAHFGDCHVMKARQQALEADVVVVNHHLFFADVALRDEGVAELLPACNTVIFDEAHALPDTASLFFGESVSTLQMIELARDARLEGVAAAKDFKPLPDAAAALERAARDVRLALREDGGRFALRAVEGNGEFGGALDNAAQKLTALAAALESQAERSEGLTKCWQRAVVLGQALGRWRDEAREDSVRWVEVVGQALHMNATPLAVGPIFRRQIEGSARAWIFTSATLSVGGDFAHYCGEMGLEGAVTKSWDSPYDYCEQALMYVPQGMPEPNTREYTPAVIEAALPVIEAAGGRTFVLFTSLRAMREGGGLIAGRFRERGLEFPLLMQGEGSRSELLERFRRLGNAVLLGSQSFWEGVDVRGEALSVVVIDKLPFAPPDDPVLAARIERINREGRSAFMEYQLPEAVITLKQGVGRLIRSESDRGVLMLCDPRVFTKGYGRKILASLPPMRGTRREEDAVRFCEGLSPASRPATAT